VFLYLDADTSEWPGVGVTSLSGCSRPGKSEAGTEDRFLPASRCSDTIPPGRADHWVSGPTDSVTEQWVVQAPGIGYSLAVFDDTVYTGSNDG